MSRFVSIIGDSISTLVGFNPHNHAVFYDKTVCFASNISGPLDTWWGKVIHHINGELLVNNSYSGSQVAKMADKETSFPSACSKERIFGLHDGDKTPDIVMIYIGTNDWGRGIPLYESEVEDPLMSFSGAYRKMLHNIKAKYPHAQIWCFTLLPACKKYDPGFVFPSFIHGHSLENYNSIIRNISHEYGCQLADLYSYHQPYDSIDGGHPSRDGMETISKLAICEIKKMKDGG